MVGFSELFITDKKKNKKKTLTFNHILFPWIQNPKMTAKEKDISTFLRWSVIWVCGRMSYCICIRQFCIPDSVLQIWCLSTILIAVFNSIMPLSAGVLQAFCVIYQQEQHICGIYRTLRRSWSRRVSMTPPRPSSRLIVGKYSQCCLILHQCNCCVSSLLRWESGNADAAKTL